MSAIKKEEERIVGIVDRLSPILVPPNQPRANWDRSHTKKLMQSIKSLGKYTFLKKNIRIKR